MQVFGAEIPTTKQQLAATAVRAAVGNTSANAGSNGEDVAAWRESLTEASFRGVTFYTESDEQKGGRRAATHEFPGRDTPFTEEMGRKARVYTVEAYVIGDDYMAWRDAMLEAIEASGPGELVVPWMESRLVICTDYSLKQDQKRGGIAFFSLVFTERGSAELPTTEIDANTLADDTTDEAQDEAGKALDAKLTIAGVPVPVQADTLAAIRKLGSTIGGVASVARLAANLPSLLTSLSNLTVADLVDLLPSELARPLFSLSSAYTALTSAYATKSTAKSRALSARVSGLLSIASTATATTAVSGAGTVRATIAANLSALAEYQRSMAVAEAARTATLVRPESKQEAQALREAVVDAIDSVLETTPDDAVFVAFVALRTATVRALASAAGEAPAVATVTTTAVQPVLALAQRYVVAPGFATDAPDAAERILARNTHVRHPGFVPPGGLEVLRAV